MTGQKEKARAVSTMSVDGTGLFQGSDRSCDE